MDKYGFKKLYALVLGLDFVNIIISYSCVSIAPIFFCCILLNNFCIGAMFICLPTSIATVFGTNYGTTVYSFVLTGSLMSSILNIFNAKFILMNFGFFASFIVCLLANILCFTLLYYFEEKLDVERIFKNKIAWSDIYHIIFLLCFNISF